jgi:hypothetical protein
MRQNKDDSSETLTESSSDTSDNEDIEGLINNDSSADSSSQEEEKTPKKKFTVNWASLSKANKIRYKKPKFYLEDETGFREEFSSRVNDPIDYFYLFFSEEFLLEICKHTQAYYLSKYRDRSKKRRASHERKWSAPDLVEMKAFFGILIYTSIVKHSLLSDYWSKSLLFSSHNVGKIMSRDRFFQIKKALHFVDEDDEDLHEDPLYKIRPVINKFIVASRALYTPGQYLTIDESMIRFNGRSSMKVYMPLKPIKYGFKAYVLAESRTGYVCNWMLYEGKGKKGNAISDIVNHLTRGLDNSGHIICMDRFYTMPSIFIDLARRNIGAIGAVMSNRAYMNMQTSNTCKNLQKWESEFFVSNKELMLTIWKDSKIVKVLSNYSTDEIVTIDRFCKEEKKYIDVDCPDIIDEYSDNSRGVDLFDQMVSYMDNHHRSKKWYFRILFHILNAAIHNSFILFADHNGKITNDGITNDGSRIKYIRSLVRSLILPARQRNNSALSPKKRERKNSGFMDLESPDFVDCHLGKEEKKNYCHICREVGKTRRTRYFCQLHNVAVCVLECYDIHRKENK